MQTVLVVEDDASVRSFIETILCVEGFRVISVSSAEAALESVQANRVDLVTIDVGLPGMSGLALSAALRAQPSTAHCRQMLVSGSCIDYDHAELVDAVLSKPFDFASFTVALRRIFAEPLQPARADPMQAELEKILRERSITSLFQPVVDLTTLEIVGAEALARGPRTSPLHSPNELFAAAHRHGLLHELDSLCRFQALDTARRARVGLPPLILINVEPGTANLPPSADMKKLAAETLPFQVGVEFTERALVRRFPAVMQHAAAIRERGNVIALDDMGVDPKAVALLPLLRPEIVKFDMSLVAVGGRLTRTAANTAVAVAAYAEETGARVIAEGIETEEHLEIAQSLGAHWGQGWLFGRPEPIICLREMPRQRTRPMLPDHSFVETRSDATPFTIAAEGRRPRTASARVLDGISQQMEHQAAGLGELGVVMVGIQNESRLQGMFERGYGELAERVAVLAFFGTDLPVEPLPGAYGVRLTRAEPLAQEWFVLVLGPHQASLLSARELSRGPHRGDRRYEFVLTHDRELVAGIARSLVPRFTPRESIPRTGGSVARPPQRRRTDPGYVRPSNPSGGSAGPAPD